MNNLKMGFLFVMLTVSAVLCISLQADQHQVKAGNLHSGTRMALVAAKTEDRDGYPGLPRLAGLAICNPDEVHTRVTGIIDKPPLSQCPASPVSLKNLSWSPLYYFDLSLDAGSAIRKSVQLNSSFEHFDRQRLECTYLVCVPVQVADRGKTYTRNESCIGPFTGGTSVPAKENIQCPAAVRIAGEYGAYRRQEGDGRCCYGWPGPVLPRP